jgi:hypothetical protein
LTGLINAGVVAVDTAGDVYGAGGKPGVLKLQAR